MMSKKDYMRAAELIRDFWNRPDLAEVYALAETVQIFVEFFRHDNPRFDEGRFREACNQAERKRGERVPKTQAERKRGV